MAKVAAWELQESCREKRDADERTALENMCHNLRSHFNISGLLKTSRVNHGRQNTGDAIINTERWETLSRFGSITLSSADGHRKHPCKSSGHQLPLLNSSFKQSKYIGNTCLPIGFGRFLN